MKQSRVIRAYSGLSGLQQGLAERPHEDSPSFPDSEKTPEGILHQLTIHFRSLSEVKITCDTLRFDAAPSAVHRD